MTTLNIHQREARLLERVAELEQENIVRESGFQTMANSMKVSMKRIAELEKDNTELQRNERLWETSMNYVIGKDGVGSVVQAVYKLKERIAELEAAFRNPHITRFKIDKILKGSTDESTDN